MFLALLACGGRRWFRYYMVCKGSCFTELLYCVVNFIFAHTHTTWCVHVYLIVNLFNIWVFLPWLWQDLNTDLNTHHWVEDSLTSKSNLYLRKIKAGLTGVYYASVSKQYNRDLAKVFEGIQVDLQDVTLLEQAGRDNLISFANSGIGHIDYESYLAEVISAYEPLLCVTPKYVSRYATKKQSAAPHWATRTPTVSNSHPGALS